MKTDEYVQQVLALVEEHGLAIQGVGAGEGQPTFAYTVGLARIRQPELIIFGLPIKVAHAVLNDAGFRILAGELNLAPGDTVRRLVSAYPVRVLVVRDSGEHLTVANRLYGNGHLPALQLVYPDIDGRWPWEDGSRVANMPLLGNHLVGLPGRELTLPEKEE